MATGGTSLAVTESLAATLRVARSSPPIECGTRARNSAMQFVGVARGAGWLRARRIAPIACKP